MFLENNQPVTDTMTKSLFKYYLLKNMLNVFYYLS